MRPLRYSVNLTLDGCCDHRAGVASEAVHRHAVENLEQADALRLGRVTYQMMEEAWRPPRGDRPDWMEPFARTIGAARKYVVSSTLHDVDWNGEGLFVGGVTLPLALAELGLIRTAPRTRSARGPRAGGARRARARRRPST